MHQNFKAVKNISSILRSHLETSQPEAIYWFGSSLSRQMTQASDIDMAILYNSKEDLALARSKIIRFVEKFEIPIDISFFIYDYFQQKKDLGGIAYIIETTGKKLYDKNPSI